MLRVLVSLVLLVMSTMSLAIPSDITKLGLKRSAPTINTSRAAVIQGPIMGRNLDPIEQAIDKYSAESSEPIDLILNSPGGSVMTGFRFLNKMSVTQAKGVKFRCFVSEVAASMAFGILVRCDERYTLNTSFLLWHRVSVVVGGLFGGAMNSLALNYLGSELAKLDKLIFQDVRSAMSGGMSEEEMQYHFDRETLHVGSWLAEHSAGQFSSFKYIPNLFTVLNDKTIPNSSSSPEDKKAYREMVQTPGTLIYMTTRNIE